jgi:16S rRNA processing protein RimM
MRRAQKSAPPISSSPPLGGGEGDLLIAIVTGPHGVKGMLRVKSFAADPEDVARYPLHNERGERVVLAVVGPARGVLLARVEGIADRDAAERLKGMRLYVSRAMLPPPEADEFYHADLLGLAVELKDGTVLGRVRAIHDFGAGDTIEIERPNAAPVVLPFTRAAVPVVDVEHGRILVEPPEGLI